MALRSFRCLGFVRTRIGIDGGRQLFVVFSLFSSSLLFLCFSLLFCHAGRFLCKRGSQLIGTGSVVGSNHSPLSRSPRPFFLPASVDTVRPGLAGSSGNGWCGVEVSLWGDFSSTLAGVRGLIISASSSCIRSRSSELRLARYCSSSYL